MKTIIVYTTKYGCTEKAAYLLKSKMGGEVDVVNLLHAQVPPLTTYHSVIFGGSIYYGKIQKEMTAFVNNAMPQLVCKRIGLFICAGSKEQAAQELQSAFPIDLLKRASASEVFGDEIYYDKLSLMDKFIMRIVKGKEKSGTGLSTTTIEKFAHAMTNPIDKM
ncbi:flavodoxin domain-containing protein [Paenibacillus sp. BR2-3]|uniref:flavodoxin domain-containing protein n=1 Tax=Paenibacillus sp. BR2-3 TaxID=3048494 RepID=UPI0039774A16